MLHFLKVLSKVALFLEKQFCVPGTYGRIAPRSGLAAKKHIDVGAGVIDPDYRGSGTKNCFTETCTLTLSLFF